MSTNGSAVMVPDDKRQGALLKAVGLDRVPVEQRELAIAIADRYQLDLLLKHVVLIEGRPYVTRDGLLHIAHRSGQFDGMEVSDPVLEGEHWRARCSVYRKDMGRPFTYAGRYPAKGGNQRFAPEMAVKVAEVMALRRAFDVSAPVLEERWDLDTTAETAPPEPPRSLRETVTDRRAQVTTSAEPATVRATVAGDADIVAVTAVEVAPEQCPSMSPYDPPSRCAKAEGHKGNHANRDRESW